MQQEKIILGMDPGTTIMGYGIIEVKGKKISLIAMGVIDLRKYSDHALKMEKIFTRSLELIDQFHPDELAVEAPFFGKNVQSMLKLGRAQGIAIAAALSRKLPYAEYAPKKIKQSITGNGNAAKEQVAGMLQNMFTIANENMPKDLDATDGLAAAVCHHFQTSTPLAAAGAKSWKSFMAQNPGRIK